MYKARLEAGKLLAVEHPVDADIVIGAPDSGLIAAMGYSRQSGIPYGAGLIKNRYVGRTFIRPSQEQREIAVRIKFNTIRSEIEGKRIVMVDDSIVRGTTTKAIVQMLKNAGAREVHIRVSSPPYRFPCYYGINAPSTKQLLASAYSLDEIRELIGADSLEYLSLEGLMRTPAAPKSALKSVLESTQESNLGLDSGVDTKKDSKKDSKINLKVNLKESSKTVSESGLELSSKCSFCCACFNGEYPIEIPCRKSGD